MLIRDLVDGVIVAEDLQQYDVVVALDRLHVEKCTFVYKTDVRQLVVVFEFYEKLDECLFVNLAFELDTFEVYEFAFVEDYVVEDIKL